MIRLARSQSGHGDTLDREVPDDRVDWSTKEVVFQYP